ncbi:MAG: hypothetical protein PWQ99_403 [Clostridia bacterium]|jgi:hypothetical protein|uniref:Uncharacterized protein n=1 Tax=Thermacetogenium phaeum TaxID=85874 RepID=A0A101FHM2_9THEO|nr:MAG: Uncharacterized protein XD66_0089 [Thermacetogenium phaeum]MDK2880628.1 hypothetical protein [Clostridia bacterium]MDN5365743.1 hypothetical protein [Thermacetogenium sp.]MDN5376033.1 hypothetical protein [Thermacetogenium sp.]
MMDVEELLAVLRKKIQEGGDFPEPEARVKTPPGAVQSGEQAAALARLQQLLPKANLPEEGEILGLIKEMTSGMSSDERQRLYEFIDRSTRQLGFGELSAAFLKMLDDMDDNG